MGNSGPVPPSPSGQAQDAEGPDERERSAAEREKVIDDREARADERDAARAAARQDDKAILDAADVRDELADDRDSRADYRDTEADRRAFLTSPGYGEDLPARRHAAVDRSDSRDDRTAAAADRSRLTAAGDDGRDATAHRDGSDGEDARGQGER